MSTFVSVGGEGIIVTLHPAAHEKANLAAVLPYAWMNAGWVLAADEQNSRTFSWKGLNCCYRLLIGGGFPQVSKKKVVNSPKPKKKQITLPKWATTYGLCHSLMLIFILQMPRFLFILFRNSLGKKPKSEFTDISASSSIIILIINNYSSERYNYTYRNLCSKLKDRWKLYFFHKWIQSLFLASHLQISNNFVYKILFFPSS